MRLTGRDGGRAPLDAVGEDPDPRFSMANERTFLAWNRTALALVGGGLATAQLLEFEVAAVGTGLALLLIGLGAAASLSSYRRWEANERALRLGRALPYSRFPRILGYWIAATAAVAAVAVVIELLAA